MFGIDIYMFFGSLPKATKIIKYIRCNLSIADAMMYGQKANEAITKIIDEKNPDKLKLIPKLNEICKLFCINFRPYFDHEKKNLAINIYNKISERPDVDSCDAINIEELEENNKGCYKNLFEIMKIALGNAEGKIEKIYISSLELEVMKDSLSASLLDKSIQEHKLALECLSIIQKDFYEELKEIMGEDCFENGPEDTLMRIEQCRRKQTIKA